MSLTLFLPSFVHVSNILLLKMISFLKDERLKKLWYIYTMEYYSAIRKKEILPFAIPWMDLNSRRHYAK